MISHLAPREAFLPFTGRVDCFMHFTQAAGEGHIIFEVTGDRQIPLVEAECFLQFFVGPTVKISADDDVALTGQSPAEQMPASQQQFCNREIVAQSKQRQRVRGPVVEP